MERNNFKNIETTKSGKTSSKEVFVKNILSNKITMENFYSDILGAFERAGLDVNSAKVKAEFGLDASKIRDKMVATMVEGPML